MNEIFTRRSIRRFTGVDVSDEQVSRVLKAGMAAPSAGNQQPWRFVVVRDRNVLAQLSKCSPYASAAAHAPVSIVVCGDLDAEIHKGFWVQDVSAAVQNMLLEVVDLGLGSVWLGVHPLRDREDKVRAAVGLPGSIVPLAVLPLGVPAQALPAQDRYDAKKVHFERW